MGKTATYTGSDEKKTMKKSKKLSKREEEEILEWWRNVDDVVLRGWRFVPLVERTFISCQKHLYVCK